MVVRGVPVEVEIHGTGTPLLMIHGWGVDRRLMTGCMEPLFDDDAPWLRIYPDLPGMGGTPGDPAIDGSADVLGMLLICPSVAPGTPADAELRVLERDDKLLASLDPADRVAFTTITVRQTRPVWERFATEILPGIRGADQR